MSSLRKAFNEQFVEIKSIINRITTGKEDNLDEANEGKYNLKFFEGIWLDESDGTTSYAKIINDELLMPYLWANLPDCRVWCQWGGKGLKKREENLNGFENILKRLN